MKLLVDPTPFVLGEGFQTYIFDDPGTLAVVHQTIGKAYIRFLADGENKFKEAKGFASDTFSIIAYSPFREPRVRIQPSRVMNRFRIIPDFDIDTRTVVLTSLTNNDELGI